MLGEQPCRRNTPVLGRRRAGFAGTDMEIGCGIDRAAVDDHPKIQMWPVGEARAPNGSDSFAAANCFAALRQPRWDQAEMTVNADEPVMLNHDLEASDPTAMNPDDGSRRDRGHRAADGRGYVNSIVERTGKLPVRHDTGSKR